MIQQLIEIRNNILSALEQNDGMLAKMYVNKLDTLLHDLSNQQETIEEAAAKHFNKEIFVEGVTIQYALQEAFITGAKWRAERMYSEEDIINFAHFYFKEEFNSTMQTNKSTKELLSEWFEKFKK